MPAPVARPSSGPAAPVAGNPMLRSLQMHLRQHAGAEAPFAHVYGGKAAVVFLEVAVGTSGCRHETGAMTLVGLLLGKNLVLFNEALCL